MVGLRINNVTLRPRSRRSGTTLDSRHNPPFRMMRIAIAGTGGLALFMAHFVNEETTHQLVILSRTVSLFMSTDWFCRQSSDLMRKPQPGLVSQGYSVQVVDYDDNNSLRHALMGVDTVISTEPIC